VVENQAGDAFHGRIAVEDEHRLSEPLERSHQRIVVTEQHLVIELFVNPSFHEALDVAEVADHVAAIEVPRADFDLGYRIVPVGMLADAVVIEQAVAVAEIDALGH